jgi:general secretion pathway protein J
MRRTKSDALLAGFSLVEATAAVALTATIVMALSSVTGQWLPNWRRGLVDLQRADLLGLGLERVVEDVSAAEYVTPWGGAPAPLFEGDASTMMFVRSAIGPNSSPHLEVIRLAEIEDYRGPALTRTRAPFTPTAPGASAQPLTFGDPVALVRAPFRVSFAYAGPDRVWVESWKRQECLPDAVRITVRDTVGNRLLATSTSVRMKVIAQGLPNVEAQANSAQSPPAPATPTPAGGWAGTAAMSARR